jgi:hypothetical protein
MEKKLKNIQTFEQHTDKNLNISDVSNRTWSDSDDWAKVWKQFGVDVYIPITGVTPTMLKDWLEENYHAPKRIG